MSNRFDLQEEFDVGFVQSTGINIEISGICEVTHARDGKTLSIDRGDNVITQTGKAELVKLMG